MTLEEIYYVSQLVSTVALIASVVYLALQTRQAARGQLAAMHQARSERFHEYTMKLTDAEFGPLARAGFHALADLDDDQVHRFYFYAVTVLRTFEEMHRQWLEGLIADARWETTQRTLAGIIRAPGYHAAYLALRGGLDSGFATLVDDLIEAARGAPMIDPVKDWRAGVAALGIATGDGARGPGGDEPAGTA